MMATYAENQQIILIKITYIYIYIVVSQTFGKYHHEKLNSHFISLSLNSFHAALSFTPHIHTRPS